VPLVHATCVAVDGRGVLLRGPSGSGKSDLALRLIDRGAVLVADDQTRISERGGQVLAEPPETIAGRIEVRGVGILALPHLRAAPVALVIDLVAAAAVERLPAPRRCELLGREMPLLTLAPFEASAAAKVLTAMRALAAGPLAR
jgi:serine kinase of HPr protein (carbohydrate metabolism regulator)